MWASSSLSLSNSTRLIAGFGLLQTPSVFAIQVLEEPRIGFFSAGLVLVFSRSQGAMNASFRRCLSNFWHENIFIFAGAERQKIYFTLEKEAVSN